MLLKTLRKAVQPPAAKGSEKSAASRCHPERVQPPVTGRRVVLAPVDLGAVERAVEGQWKWKGSGMTVEGQWKRQWKGSERAVEGSV